MESGTPVLSGFRGSLRRSPISRRNPSRMTHEGTSTIRKAQEIVMTQPEIRAELLRSLDAFGIAHGFHAIQVFNAITHTYK